MTRNEKWKIAKWIKHHGTTERKDVPAWFAKNISGNFDFFHVSCSETDGEGFPIVSDIDLFEMNDREIDAYITERRNRIHEFRDWLEPVGVIFATILSLVSLVVSLIK